MKREKHMNSVTPSGKFFGRQERGVALIAVMLALLLVTAIAAGIIILTNTETATSTNFKDEQRAYFAAKAGIEEARDRMRKGNAYSITTTTSPALPAVLPGNSNSLLYITNPLNSETVSPTTVPSTSSPNPYVDDEICTEPAFTSAGWCSGGYPGSGTYTTTANSTFAPTSGSVFDWKWVRISLKQDNQFGPGYYVNGSTTSSAQVYWSGTNECILVNCSTATEPVYVLTALAVTPSGSRRMLQAEVVQDTLNYIVPAALTMDGSGALFSGGNSGNFGVSGIDVGGCGSAASGASVPAVGAVSAADAALIASSADIPNNTASNYTGSGGTTPDVENVSSTLPATLSTPANLQKLASTLMSAVTQPVITGPYSSSGGGNTFGSTLASPQIVYVNGDATIGGSQTGYGILVVTGNLTYHGTAEWDGLVLVVGKGNFQMDGTNTFKGSILVADTVNSLGSVLSVLGNPNYNVNGGGNPNAGVNYSASCMAQATQLSTYHVVSYRELMK